MKRRFLLKLGFFVVSFTALYAKSPEWQSGDVTAMDVIRTPVGKKIKYRYSYTLHANAGSCTAPEDLSGIFDSSADCQKSRLLLPL
jgi:hypothetical protein